MRPCLAHREASRGFTLVEVGVVLAVAATLATLARERISSALTSARVSGVSCARANEASEIIAAPAIH